jgi:DNA-binding NarL/FixJ family response regulator
MKIKPGVKVLISSGCDIDDHVTEILGKNCNGFIQKPYTLEELSDRLNDMLAEG